MVHELATDPMFENLVEHLLAKSSFGFKERRNLEESLLLIKENKKLPSEFIKRAAAARSKAFQLWEEAREKESFKVFVPALKEIVELEREKADLLSFESHPYDALLNLYERNLKVKDLEKIFGAVKREIVPLVKKIANAEQVDDSFLYGHFNKDKQWAFSLELLKEMKYDFDAGRQDLSTHPFTINFNSNDVSFLFN